MTNLLHALPVMPVRLLTEAVAFYRDKLGFESRHQESGFAIMMRGSVQLHLTQLNDERWKTRTDFLERPISSGAESFIPGTASCRVRVDDATNLYAEYERRHILHPNSKLRDQWWGDRDFGVVDPDGNLITFYQRDAAPRRSPE